jgi:hypothetical protein
MMDFVFTDGLVDVDLTEEHIIIEKRLRSLFAWLIKRNRRLIPAKLPKC